MAGLFSSQRCAGGQHLFEDVLVADGGAQHSDPRALERGFQAHVGHGRRHDRGVGQQAASGEVAGREQQDGVAVDDVAVRIGKHGAVGVSVEGNSHRGVVLDDLGGDGRGIERAAVLVDVAAIGRGVSEDDCAGEFREELGRDGAGCAVGAVDDDALAVEREAGDGGEQGANILGAVGFVDGRFEIRGSRFEALRFEATEDLGFDGEFGRVGQLVAIGAEELDAVVDPWIVRGGDDDASRKFVRASEECDGGRGNDARALDGRAGGNQARGQRGGDPVGGLARVLSDQNAWRIAKVMRQREADGVDGDGVERELAGDTANAVGAK